MGKSRVMAIDGPSGSGKSTVAKKLAQELNLLYIDTGSMFRGLAHYTHVNNVAMQSGLELTRFLANCQLQYGISQDQLIIINGVNLTQAIREHHVSKLASIISQLPEVRDFLLKFQRDLVLETCCVMEGRDIGTVVFPDSFCKVFITASVDVRANRRLNQLRGLGNDEVSLEQVIEDVKKRDASDINREVAPLKQADDAYFMDTTNLNLDEIIDQLKIIINKKADLCDIIL
jgi:CMP/dCMP kinase